MDKLNRVKYVVDQLIVQGNLEIIDSAFSENYIAHSGDKKHQGHKFIKQFAKQLRRAIPDIKTSSIILLSQTETIITWQRTFSGTHKTDFKGIPASNKKIKWHEIIVSRFDENKIIEEWVVSDLAFQLMIKHK